MGYGTLYEFTVESIASRTGIAPDVIESYVDDPKLVQSRTDQPKEALVFLERICKVASNMRDTIHEERRTGGSVSNPTAQSRVTRLVVAIQILLDRYNAVMSKPPSRWSNIFKRFKKGF